MGLKMLLYSLQVCYVTALKVVLWLPSRPSQVFASAKRPGQGFGFAFSKVTLVCPK